MLANFTLVSEIRFAVCSSIRIPSGWLDFSPLFLQGGCPVSVDLVELFGSVFFALFCPKLFPVPTLLSPTTLYHEHERERESSFSAASSLHKLFHHVLLLRTLRANWQRFFHVRTSLWLNSIISFSICWLSAKLHITVERHPATRGKQFELETYAMI